LERARYPPSCATKITASPNSNGGFKRFFSVGTQHFDFKIREQNLSRQFRGFSAQQGHQHDAPGNDQVYGHSPSEALGGVVGHVFNAAAGLQNPVPVFYAPAEAIPAHAFHGFFRRGDFFRGQQEPFNSLSIRGRIFLPGMNRPYLNGLLVLVIVWRLERHIQITHR